MGGIINSINTNNNEDLNISLTERLIQIENKITDYEMFSILNTQGKYYSNNFCDFISFLRNDYIFENEVNTKEFLLKNFGEIFVEFVFSSDFLRKTKAKT
jgi:hypothetical protein